LGVARIGRSAQNITGTGIVVITALGAVTIAELTFIDHRIAARRLTLAAHANLQAATLAAHVATNLTA